VACGLVGDGLRAQLPLISADRDDPPAPTLSMMRTVPPQVRRSRVFFAAMTKRLDPLQRQEG
jgi:hypothetical protein